MANEFAMYAAASARQVVEIVPLQTQSQRKIQKRPDHQQIPPQAASSRGKTCEATREIPSGWNQVALL
jgi:hypothetical protein